MTPKGKHDLEKSISDEYDRLEAKGSTIVDQSRGTSRMIALEAIRAKPGKAPLVECRCGERVGYDVAFERCVLPLMAEVERLTKWNLSSQIRPIHKEVVLVRLNSGEIDFARYKNGDFFVGVEGRIIDSDEYPLRWRSIA